MEKIRERKSHPHKVASSRSGCHQCERYREELASKDEIIKRLKDTLRTIHQVTDTYPGVASQSPSSKAPKKRRFKAQVNVGIDVPSNASSSIKRSRHSTPTNGKQHTDTTATVKVQVRQSGSRSAQNTSHEGGVITIQEIIDKVVEQSPKRKKSHQIRDESSSCLQALFFDLLESKLKSQDSSDLRKRSLTSRAEPIAIRGEFGIVETSQSSCSSSSSTEYSDEYKVIDYSNRSWKMENGFPCKQEIVSD